MGQPAAIDQAFALHQLCHAHNLQEFGMAVDPAGLPSPWNVSNYVGVLTSDVFWQEVGNSAIAGITTTAGVVLLGLMVSFVLARYTFRGRGAIYALFASGLMFPITVAMGWAATFSATTPACRSTTISAVRGSRVVRVTVLLSG